MLSNLNDKTQKTFQKGEFYKKPRNILLCQSIMCEQKYKLPLFTCRIIYIITKFKLKIKKTLHYTQNIVNSLGRLNSPEQASMGAAGSHATKLCEPRQVRKEATVSKPFRVT